MIFCPYSRSDTNYKICDFLTNFFECPPCLLLWWIKHRSDEKKLMEEICGTPPKSIVLDPIAWVCTTSLYRWMTMESWAKVDQKHFPPTMFHHRLCPSLPCFPQADIPSAVRPSIAVRLTKSRATSLFPQGPKNSQFSATGPWIRLSFFFFRPLLVWNAQWTECGFCPTM